MSPDKFEIRHSPEKQDLLPTLVGDPGMSSRIRTRPSRFALLGAVVLTALAAACSADQSATSVPTIIANLEPKASIHDFDLNLISLVVGI